MFNLGKSANVLTLPVAAEPTLRAIKHLKHFHVTNSDKKCTCQLEVVTRRDCLKERFCFASTWFLHRLFIGSKLMSSQRTMLLPCGRSFVSNLHLPRRCSEGIVTRSCPTNPASRLFTVPYFFVRSFRYTASYHHGYCTEGAGVGDNSSGGGYFSRFVPNRPPPPTVTQSARSR